MIDIEQYKMTTGYYDTAKIRTDAGMSERAARFLDIFGSFDDDGKDSGGSLPGEWQALLDEANRRNAEMFAAAEQTKEREAVSLMTADETWPRATWRRLRDLGYASYYSDPDAGYWEGRLNERGQALFDRHERPQL